MTDSNLSISGDGTPNVPVYNCRVFVKTVDRKCHARVANFPDLQITAANERAALAEVVRTFKAKIAEYTQAADIPWLDPELTIESDEVERLIPVHL